MFRDPQDLDGWGRTSFGSFKGPLPPSELCLLLTICSVHREVLLHFHNTENSLTLRFILPESDEVKSWGSRGNILYLRNIQAFCWCLFTFTFTIDILPGSPQVLRYLCNKKTSEHSWDLDFLVALPLNLFTHHNSCSTRSSKLIFLNSEDQSKWSCLEICFKQPSPFKWSLAYHLRPSFHKSFRNEMNKETKKDRKHDMFDVIALTAREVRF